MKKLVALMAVLMTTVPSIAQKTEPSCFEKCEIRCLCTHFFKQHLNDTHKINTITDNWHGFFNDDLETLFPPQTQGVKIISIKFDGLGCIYPEGNPYLAGVKNDFNDNNYYKYFTSESFFYLFTYLTNPGAETQKFIGFSTVKPQNNCSYFDFADRWNQEFAQAKVDEINSALDSSDIKKVIFYIHGYNVPYSLAHMQGNVLLDSIMRIGKYKPEEVLFIRVYWPSGNLKRSEFNKDGCNYDNFEGLLKGSKTVNAFTYVSNKAYMAGVALRVILDSITWNEFDIITHSHGSTVATTALINTVSKFQRGELSDSLGRWIPKHDFPEKRINVFLNAPSIPGPKTFGNISNTFPQTNYYFFVGYNEKDLVLRKQKIKLMSFIHPTEYFSSTSLGCNKRRSVIRTRDVFIKKGMKDNYRSRINSIQEEHDFFCYISQEEFTGNLELFLNGLIFR